jgi:hypothetical protein
MELRKLTGGILLFDEADALFGKGIEVRNIEVRYANLETSDFVHRFEFRGQAAVFIFNTH